MWSGCLDLKLIYLNNMPRNYYYYMPSQTSVWMAYEGRLEMSPQPVQRAADILLNPSNSLIDRDLRSGCSLIWMSWTPLKANLCASILQRGIIITSLEYIEQDGHHVRSDGVCNIWGHLAPVLLVYFWRKICYLNSLADNLGCSDLDWINNPHIPESQRPFGVVFKHR